MGDGVLHVTNGDSAAERIRAAGEAGEILSWRDVLHEGPVPAGLDASALREVRARFLADSEWASFDAVLADLEARDATLASANEREIVLWFEHDLYDQLQLLQVLDTLADRRDGCARGGTRRSVGVHIAAHLVEELPQRRLIGHGRTPSF